MEDLWAILSTLGCLVLVEDPWAILSTIRCFVLVEGPWDVLNTKGSLSHTRHHAVFGACVGHQGNAKHHKVFGAGGGFLVHNTIRYLVLVKSVLSTIRFCGACGGSLGHTKHHRVLGVCGELGHTKTKRNSESKNKVLGACGGMKGQ